MIELQNISAGFSSHTVLHDLSLTFPAGKVTVLLGPNGCGKSTLLKTALGLLRQSSGHIFYDGIDADTFTARERACKAAYLSQTRSVPKITAGRLVLHGRFPHLEHPRRYRKEDYDIVRDALNRVGALELYDRQLETLSGGQRQKIYMAMALAQETDAIFMDEPTTYLDVRHQLEAMKIAQTLAEEGRTVILVLHDLSQALQVADQIAVLADGRLRGVGSPEEIYVSGILDRVFGVRVRRISAEHGWHYYCEAGTES